MNDRRVATKIENKIGKNSKRIPIQAKKIKDKFSAQTKEAIIIKSFIEVEFKNKKDISLFKTFLAK